MTIREPDLERDAHGVAALLMATGSWLVTTPASWRHYRESIPERARSIIRVAVVDDRVVGVAESGVNFFGSGEAGSLGLRVDHAHRGQGIGRALYAVVADHLVELGVTSATCMFDENEPGVAFAHDRGWREVRAEAISSVDPRTVTDEPDPEVDVVPARELDPHELHHVDEVATRDMPAVEQITSIPYDEWVAFVWENPLFTRDGSFGVVLDGHVVALSLILANLEYGRAISMFTGTLPDYRGRGLARATKIASARWAAENGITQLSTTNDELNAPMLAVNERLGYRPSGRRVEYLKEL